MMLLRRARRALALALLSPQVGCAASEPALPPKPDRAQFERVVYPLLLRDCGFPACHATSDQFFQVFGPGRVRMDPEQDVFAPATTRELDHAYGRARSMLLPMPDTADSLLLRKPLSPAAGGAGHDGEDSLGQDVYASREAAGYRVLFEWAMGGHDQSSIPTAALSSSAPTSVSPGKSW